ncbi:MAG: 30S ribosomal protein S7 [Candidatus Aenigmarchaeota archaeon]|nr:30S ribosomal protein S7 [Candidatus Aenigmarchaeota archaeon]
MKIFDRWPVKDVKVEDKGLEQYINLRPVLVPRSGGRYSKHQLHKSKMNIVERLMNKLQVPGHRSRKHVITSGKAVGKTNIHYKILKAVFERVEQQTKKNPIEVLVKAIENSALREEITQYQVGGIMVRRAVITSPQRRVDLSLSNIVQAAYRKSFGKKDTMVDTLTNEILGAYNKDGQKSEAIKEKERIEREAEGAR